MSGPDPDRAGTGTVGTGHDGSGDRPVHQTHRRDWFGTVCGALFVVISLVVLAPLLASLFTPDQVRSASRWVLAPGLVMVGGLGLLLATRSRR